MDLHSLSDDDRCDSPMQVPRPAKPSGQHTQLNDRIQSQLFPRCPPSSIEWICSATGKQLHQLSSMVVPDNSSVVHLYRAILNYAYASSDPAGCSTPLSVSTVSFTNRKSQNHDSDDNSDDDSDDGSDDERLFKGMDVPIFNMGYGDVAVVWPPPPYLGANAMKELHRRKVEPQYNCSAFVDSLITNGVNHISISEGDTGCDHHHSKTTEGSNVTSESSSPPKLDPHERNRETPTTRPDTSRTTTSGRKKDRVFPDAVLKGSYSNTHMIYVSHYQYSVLDGLDLKELVLFSEGPIKVLENFTKQVLMWDGLRQYIPPKPPVSSINEEEHYFRVYRLMVDNNYVDWVSEGQRRARPAESVILDAGAMDAILSDVRSFLSGETREWYIEHGLQLRRSYLFYGPPGVGKTSAIRAIASEFELACCFLSAANDKFSNQNLMQAIAKLPKYPLLVLEDVDALFNGRAAQQGHGMTFSGLLNALDGVVSKDGVVTIMTTNHPERLDEALLRAGRVDRRFYFSAPTDEMIKNYLKSFYKNATSEDAEAFLQAVKRCPKQQYVRSLASLQQLFIALHGQDVTKCIDEVESFFEHFIPIEAPKLSGSSSDGFD